MYEKFDIDENVDKLKSTLFDLYEEQERIIGTIENDIERNEYVQKYILVKDNAIKLIESIVSLYQENKAISMETPIENEVSKEDISIEVPIENEASEEDISIEVPIENEASEEDISIEVPIENEVSKEDISMEVPVENEASEEDISIEVPIENETSEEDISIEVPVENETSEEDISMEVPVENETSEEDISMEVPVENEVSTETTKESAVELEKFYLDSRNGDKPNFAYVPETIYAIIKENANLDGLNRIYKKDTKKPKGIIVRSDQFMKLSFSKDRQESVLKEARLYRIELAKKERERLRKETEE